jgi:hypothetical protein
MLRSMTSPTQRIALLDVGLAAVFVALAIAFMLAVSDDEGVTWAAVPVFALVPLGLLARRAAPLAGLGALIVAVGIHVAAFGTVTRCGLALPVDGILVFAAAARLPLRQAALGWALGLGAAMLVLGWDESAPIDEAGAFIAVLLTVVWAAGAALHAVAHRTASEKISLEPARS